MAVALVALVIAAAGIAVAAIPGSGGVIHACYNASNGALRVVDEGVSCKSNERALGWNQQGRPGPPGPPGPSGTVGQPEQWRYVGSRVDGPCGSVPGRFCGVWENLQPVPEGRPRVSFYKDQIGRVHLRGDLRCRGVCSSSNPDFNEPYFVLPERYRPRCVHLDGATEAAIVRVEPDGEVRRERFGGLLRLDGVSFRADGPTDSCAG